LRHSDFLYAFISQDGLTEGTRFEVEYALKLGIPAQVHWEYGISQIIHKYPLPLIEEKQTVETSSESMLALFS